MLLAVDEYLIHWRNCCLVAAVHTQGHTMQALSRPRSPRSVHPSISWTEAVRESVAICKLSRQRMHCASRCTSPCVRPLANFRLEGRSVRTMPIVATGLLRTRSGTSAVRLVGSAARREHFGTDLVLEPGDFSSPAQRRAPLGCLGRPLVFSIAAACCPWSLPPPPRVSRVAA